MRRSFCASARRRLACHHPSNRAEHLLIYRNPSHTNPKRRKGFLKQAGQKSVKEELPKQRKGPKRAEKCRLKVPTHIWEQDAGSSSLPTRTKWTRVGVLNSFLRLSNTPTLVLWEKVLIFQAFSFLMHNSVIHIAKDERRELGG